MLTRLVLPAVALLLTVALGLWVSQVGRPYNAVLFNIHKLVALSAIILTGWAAVRTLQTMGAPAAASHRRAAESVFAGQNPVIAACSPVQPREGIRGWESKG